MTDAEMAAIAVEMFDALRERTTPAEAAMVLAMATGVALAASGTQLEKLDEAFWSVFRGVAEASFRKYRAATTASRHA